MKMGRFRYRAAADWRWRWWTSVVDVGLLVNDRLPVRNRYASICHPLASLLWAHAEVTADLPVDELERVSHGIPYVGQAEEKQRYTDDGVQDSDHFTPRGFWGDVAVTCVKIQRFRSYCRLIISQKDVRNKSVFNSETPVRQESCQNTSDASN